MAAFATVTFTIPDQVTAQAICDAICPGAGLNLAAAKQAIVNWITSMVVANKNAVAQQAALAAVVPAVPPVLT